MKPGEAVVLDLDAAMPDIQNLRTQAALSDPTALTRPNFGVHVGVIFNALTPSGELLDGSEKIYRFTEMTFDGSHHVGNKPRRGDNSGLIDLL